MRITDVKTVPYRIPHTSLAWSKGIRSELEAVVIQIQTDEGFTGVGECTAYTNSLENTFLILDRYVRPRLIGRNPFDIGPILSDYDDGLWEIKHGNDRLVKATLDMALYDLVGKKLGVPVHALLGGQYRDRIPLTGVIGAGTVEEVVNTGKRYRDEGRTTLKLKVGRNTSEDITKIKALREHLGYDIRLRLDPNGALSVKESLRLLETVERYEIELIEDPAPVWDVDGMREVSRRTTVPVAAHYSAFDLANARRIVEMKAADAFVIEPGIHRARSLIALAEMAGVGVIIQAGNFGPGVAAGIHLAASLKHLQYACDLDPYYLGLDQYANPEHLRIEQGFIFVPTGTGLGIDLDEEKLSQFEVNLV